VSAKTGCRSGWVYRFSFSRSLTRRSGCPRLVVTTAVWTDLSKALNPVSKAYSGLGGVGALIATYVALLAATTAGAAALKADLKRFALGFTAVFWIGYLSWIAGSYANFAVTTPADMQKIRHQLVAQAHQRGRVHPRARRGPGRREFLSELRRVDEGSRQREAHSPRSAALGGFTSSAHMIEIGRSRSRCRCRSR